MRIAPLSPGLSSLWATVWQPLHQSWLLARESPSQWVPHKGALDRQTNGWTDRCMHRAVVVVLTPQEGRLGKSVHNAWYKMPLGRCGHCPAGLGAGERQRAWFSGSRGRAHPELMSAQLPRDMRHFRGRGSCLIRCPSGLLSGSEPGIQPGFPPSARLPSTTWHHVCPLLCIWIIA